MEKRDEFTEVIEAKMKKTRTFTRVVWIVFVLALIFFISSLLYAWFVSIKNTNTDQEAAVQSHDAYSQTDDADGDGLFDWQEELYGTSKTLRDSDGDGMSDGEEVALSRDPNYYGEGISEDVVAPQEVIYEEYTPPVPDSLQGNGSLTEGLNFVTEKPEISADTRSTLNTLGLAVINTYTQESQNIALFQQLFSRDPSLDVTRIQSIIDRNQRSATQLEVLTNKGDLQLETQSLRLSLNGVAIALQSLIDAQGIEEQEYNELVLSYNLKLQNLQRAMNAVHQYVLAKEVVFGPGEPGRFFLYQL